MIKELNHVGLRMLDLDKGLHLYRDTLGGQVILNALSLDGKGHIIYVQMGNTVIELILTRDAAAQGYAHLAFLLKGKDLDAMYEKLLGQGYAFSMAPKLAGTGNGRLAFFDNGAGLTLELVERTEDIRRTPFATEAFQKLDHITVCVPADHQADTARIFVQELGFVRENDRRFRLGDDVIEMEDMAPGRSTLDNLVFHVKDAAATEALLRQNGYAPERQGNALALIGPGGEKLVFEQK